MLTNYTYRNRDRRGGHGSTELKGSIWEKITPVIRKVQKQMLNRKQRYEQQRILREDLRLSFD